MDRSSKKCRGGVNSITKTQIIPCLNRLNIGRTEAGTRPRVGFEFDYISEFEAIFELLERLKQETKWGLLLRKSETTGNSCIWSTYSSFFIRSEANFAKLFTVVQKWQL
jgi:hypothetical protein